MLDATGAYHREMVRQMGQAHDHVITPMMQLQDRKTRVIIVTLAETTPVLEAAGLQQDLRRAGIEPWAWVINNNLAAAKPSSRSGHPCPSRTAADRRRCRAYAQRIALTPLLKDDPVGVDLLAEMAG
ncbi:arsenical pump-driving ATPase [Klebsiella quasipneumoniae]|uniref:arsenical pump-driving ATPase n=1 Tax=Klebsiella quasipneumoniae TaxID=1463165 RepID=UPI00388F9AB6